MVGIGTVSNSQNYSIQGVVGKEINFTWQTIGCLKDSFYR